MNHPVLRVEVDELEQTPCVFWATREWKVCEADGRVLSPDVAMREGHALHFAGLTAAVMNRSQIGYPTGSDADMPKCLICDEPTEGLQVYGAGGVYLNWCGSEECAVKHGYPDGRVPPDQQKREQPNTGSDADGK